MVEGIAGFKTWFRGFEENYVIIGGTACDLLMTEGGSEFRATKDVDMVVILEALSLEFGFRFWEYIKAGGYKFRNKSTEKPHFYRFYEPSSHEYPYMIELFIRREEGIAFSSDAVLSPLPIGEDISSLSAILLDDNYYEFLKAGAKMTEELPILDAGHLIPFKAKAWLNLTERKANGVHVNTRDIKKHRRDVIQLSSLFTPEYRLVLPKSIETDVREFLDRNTDEGERFDRIRLAFGLE
ncbi:hypothetical protein AGMMS49983_09330 [Clostridia bacterium]|nr:hypothetical protein AGMMS49983_09330 [Clostridia bacterium]